MIQPLCVSRFTGIMARDSIFVFEDRILTIEAEEAVKEIAFAVQDVKVSQKLPYRRDLVYINLTTKENQKYCVELSVQGFRIVGREFDRVENTDANTGRFFETIYALLDNVSPEYRNSFGDALMRKLSQLQQEEEESDEGQT